MLHQPLDETLLPDEREWLDRVVNDLSNDELKLVYADWLEEHDDPRSTVLRSFVKAGKSMAPSDFPGTDEFFRRLELGQNEKEPDEPLGRIPAQWLEMIGYTLVAASAHFEAPEFKDTTLRLARPALRIRKTDAKDDELPLGASKIGGLPDMPAHVPWVPGGDCHAIYNDDTGGTDRLACFMGQLNLEEISRTYASGRPTTPLLPNHGVLSFFCFQDIENDNPDAVGVQALWFPRVDELTRKEPPGELTEGNEVMAPRQLHLEETLDLPEPYDGPWSDEMKFDYDSNPSKVTSLIRELNFENILGYGRATSGGDPTSNRQSRHLIILDNAVECRMHIQIPQAALTAGDFSQITLDWVDFD